MIRQENDYDIDDIDTREVTCGSSCGHFDSFNQCCWLSWWNKQEGDHCNYGLVMVDGEVYTPQELEQLRGSSESETI